MLPPPPHTQLAATSSWAPARSKHGAKHASMVLSTPVGMIAHSGFRLGKAPSHTHYDTH